MNSSADSIFDLVARATDFSTLEQPPAETAAPRRAQLRVVEPGAASVGNPRWKSLLAGTARGDGYTGDERNILLALEHAPELAGALALDEFRTDIIISRDLPWRSGAIGHAWCDNDDTQLLAWLQSRDIRARSRSAVAACVSVSAARAGFHPVRDYLNGLKWDGEPRLQVWLAEYLNAAGDPEYQAAVGKRWMIGAVARVMEPGCKVDNMLVLEGRQGLRKSSAAAVLAVRASWFVDDLPDLGDKEAKIQLRGKWIIEVAELATIRKSQIEATKRFLAAREDTYRAIYGLRTADWPRQCVFIGTTNDREYLRDATGNRRYWPVKCGKINLAALERDRDQLWAEAVVEYRAGTQWYLMDQEEELARGEQALRVHVSEFEQDVHAYLTRQRAAGRVEIETREVLAAVLGIEQGAPGWTDASMRNGTKLSVALERAGWEKVGRPGGQRTVYKLTGEPVA